MTMLGIRHYPTLLFSLMGLFLVVTIGTSTFYAEERATKGKLALPGEDCQTNPLESWTPQEQWVWEQVCAGKIANFDLAKGYGGILDPKEPKVWLEKRILSPAFLETILLHEPYRGALTRGGVQIIGAWFKESVNLSNACLAHQLCLRNSRFDSDVYLSRLRAPFSISLAGSKFKGKLDMGSINVANHLFMRGGAEFDKEVVLVSAKIGNQLDMSGSKFEGKLVMDSINVASSLFMRGGAEFDKEVVLRSAKIGGQIDMSGSKFKSKLNMDKLDVASSLVMRDGAEFDKEVVLVSAKIGNQLDMSGSKFEGKLVMDSINVASSLFMRDGAEFDKEVVLRSAKIGGQLDMSGSKFKGKLVMDSIDVASSLFMKDGAEFDKEVVLGGAKIGGQLGIIGSKFKGKLNMDSINVENHLFILDGAEFNKEVVLRGAKIGDQLGMIGSKFKGKLNMDSINVENHLFMRDGAEFDKEVVLRGAKIGDQLDMSGSKFEGKLDMDNIDVASSLFMRDGAEFDKEVVLRGAKIGGQLSMSGSKFKGKLDMGKLQVNATLFMCRKASFAKDVSLPFSKIGSNLNISNGKFTSLNLTGTKIGGKFHLGSTEDEAPKWQPDSKLTLRNTQVGTLHDLSNAWPNKLVLDGFTYARLGGFTSDSAKSMATREISWFKEWLKKQKSYSPQPYEQLARVLRESGHAAKSRKILFAAREQERVKLRKDGAWPSWFWATVKLALIGHGYRIHYAIFWAIGFVLVGVGVLCISKQGRKNGMPYGFSYSLDLLLPVIKLREYHYEKVDIKGLARYYFYLHQIMGYVLASFLIGGLSGLIK